MKRLRAAVSVLACIAAFVTAAPALAEGRTPQTSGVIDEAQRWLTAATLGPTVASEPSLRTLSTTAERSATALTLQQPFVDFSPNASVVARDWHGSMKIVGDRTMLVDEMRPTSSNRMLMGRLATNARLTTFVQAGVGEWRIDPAMFPNARSYSEMAGQIGAGFELRLTSDVRIAGETQYTVLYRDLHYTADDVAPRMLSFFFALDGRF